MDVEQDTQLHISAVGAFLTKVRGEIRERARQHDASKLESPEKEMYEVWRPRLDSMDIESQEYKEALAQMGDGLKHHYAVNRHHPEHFENGVYEMNLIDIIEMVCDWKAAAARKGESVNMAWAANRFTIVEGSQLYCIIKNTLDFLDG